MEVIDEEIVLRSSMMDGISLWCFIKSDLLLKDVSIFINGIKNKWIGFNDIKKDFNILDNEEFGLLLANDWKLLYYADKLSPRLLGDKNFILKCLKIFSTKFQGWECHLLRYIDSSLKKDYLFNIEILTIFPSAYTNLDGEMMSKHGIIFDMIEKGDLFVIEECPKDYQMDKEFVKYCLRLNKQIWSKMNKKFRDDEEFIDIYVGIYSKLYCDGILQLKDIKFNFQ